MSKRTFGRKPFSWARCLLLVSIILVLLHITATFHLLREARDLTTTDESIQSPIGRKLLSVSLGNSTGNNSDSSHHGPVWEQCDFENAHSPYAWLPLYVFIIFVIFVGIAIICDDFFVPSLEAISEKLDLSEDVAGATFMAAGSSAPELFTSVAGVGTNSDVGVGTIVGSAMFNILVIVALSAVLAGQILHLDWRPLFRDSIVYASSIALFIGFSWDGKLEWWEALILLVMYIAYIVLMKFNKYLMKLLVKFECFWCRNQSRIQPEDNKSEVSISNEPHGSEHSSNLNCKGSHSNEKSEQNSHSNEKGEQKHRFVHSHRGELAGSFVNQRRSSTHSHHSQTSNKMQKNEHHKTIEISLPSVQVTNQEHSITQVVNDEVEDDNKSKISMESDTEEKVLVLIPYLPPIRCTPPDIQQAKDKGALGWIKFVLKCSLFVICFPFVVAYSWTIPDCTKNKKWYVVAFSFIMSIFWIALTSFALVTIVARTGCILKIDQFTMGLVVIAVGTSIPDCLSSILVARDGFGDMAVSNAIGSNVFDINLGIGLPFLISIIIKGGTPFLLVSQQMLDEFEAGEFLMIPHAKFGFLLTLALIVALTTLALFRFKLNKWTGVCFVIIYVLFLVYAFLQELLPGCDAGRRC